MINKNFLRFGMGLALTVAPGFSFAAPAKVAAKVEQPASSLYKLSSIVGESAGKTSTVSIIFDRKPSWSKPIIESHGTFLQIILPQTLVPNPGEFFDGHSTHIQKLAAFQISPETAAVRLFVDKDASIIEKALTADILDNRLMVTLDHEALKVALKNDPSVSAANNSMPSAEQVVAKVAVDRELAEPAAALQKIKKDSPQKLASLLKSGDGLSDRLYKIAFFLSALLLGSLVILTARQVVRRRKGYKESKEVIRIKTLATHALAPKQSLTLIQVGGEQILIGVTPGNINYIKTIEAPALASTTRLKRLEPSKVLQPAKVVTRPTKFAPNASVQPTKRQVEASRSEENETTTSNFEARIDDEGITQSRKARVSAPQEKDSHKAINDVTRLIREKLKNLPSM